jgi:hypothetical protein
MIPTIEEIAARFLEATYSQHLAAEDYLSDKIKKDSKMSTWDAALVEEEKAKKAYISARIRQDEDDKHADRSESCRQDADIEAQADAAKSAESTT